MWPISESRHFVPSSSKIYRLDFFLQMALRYRSYEYQHIFVQHFNR